MNALEWIEQTLHPRPCASGEFLYDHMDSQSDRGLPIIYQPFDVANPGHWADRGSLFDFLHSAGSGKILDFGPGDGWPSLILAPYVDQVIGVDGSRRRVTVCSENARRLGIGNAQFIYVEPGAPLPFDDGSFDGATAASSIEQTPDPYATLKELHRVLRPGGRLRLSYEGLACYRDRPELEAWFLDIDDHTCRLMIYDRDIEGERVHHYGLTLAMSKEKAERLLTPGHQGLTGDALTVERLQQLAPSISETLTLTLTHPAGPTWARWLREVGFSQVQPTHSGAYLAGRLFDAFPTHCHPEDMNRLDVLLEPVVRVVVRLAAPLDRDPMITAVK